MPTKRPVELTKEAPSKRYTTKAPPASVKSDSSSQVGKPKALCLQKKFQAPPPVRKDCKVKDKKEKKDSKDKEKARKKQDKEQAEKKNKKQVEEKAKQKQVEKEKTESQKVEKREKLRKNLAPDFDKEVEIAGRKAMKADIQNKLAALKKASDQNASDEDESGPESLSAALQPLLQAQKDKPAPDEGEDEESDGDDEEEEGSAGSEEDEGGGEDEDDSDFQEESDDEDESSSDEDSAEEEGDGEGQNQGRKPALRRPSAASTTSTPATPAPSEGQGSTDLALVAHESEKSAQLVRNSVNSKKEWDSFNRAIQNKKCFPVELSSYVLKNKNCLFNAWCDANRNWDECKLIMERTQKNSTEGLSGWVAVKGRDLVSQYGEAKAEALMTKRYAAGLYYDDEDFPDDKLERNYFMKKQKEVTKRQITEDATKLRGEVGADRDAVLSLIDESEGLMRAGVAADLGAANAAGQKALLEGLADGQVQKAAPKKRPKKGEEEEGATEVAPKTMAEQASDLMSEVLSEATTARKKSMALGGAAFSGELASQLLEHAETMEKHYKVLQAAVNGKIKDEDFYTKAFAKIEKDRQWFASAEPAADSILSGLKRAANKSKGDGSRKSKGRKAKEKK